MVAKHDEHWHFHTFTAIEDLAKDRRLGNREADIQADEHEYRTGKEWNSPTEVEELLVGEVSRERQKHSAGKEETHWRAQLRKHPVPRMLPWRGIFNGQQHRAAPVAAETEALTETAERQ